MPAQPPQTVPSLTYVDRPEVPETFADSLERLFVDGASVRLEFVVNRFDDPQPPKPPTGKKYTACRVVLPIGALPQVLNQLSNIMKVLVQQGVFQPVHPGPTPGSKPN